MTSEAQIAANRENAKSSTGPKTEAGKAASAQNARRHGLSALNILVPADRLDEFKEMYARYYDEIKPIGEIQTDYFEQLVHAKWNLNIARELHVSALLETDDKKIAVAARYIAQFERSYAKAHQALKQEQTDLALRAIPENEPIAGLPAACRIEKIGGAPAAGRSVACGAPGPPAWRPRPRFRRPRRPFCSCGGRGPRGSLAGSPSPRANPGDRTPADSSTLDDGVASAAGAPLGSGGDTSPAASDAGSAPLSPAPGVSR